MTTTDRDSTLRRTFVARFSEEDAARIEAAAEEHQPGNPGSDYFRWAMLIGIGYECVTRYREHHGIEAGEDEINSWLDDHALDFGEHDGDFDGLALFAGAYSRFGGDAMSVTFGPEDKEAIQ